MNNSCCAWQTFPGKNCNDREAFACITWQEMLCCPHFPSAFMLEPLHLLRVRLFQISVVCVLHALASKNYPV